jgi:hypothetical protein
MLRDLTLELVPERFLWGRGVPLDEAWLRSRHVTAFADSLQLEAIEAMMAIMISRGG